MITDGHYFYNEIYDLLEEHFDTGDESEMIEAAKELPDDYELEFRGTEIQPIVKLSSDFIMDRINEERFTEDGNDWDEVYNLLEKHIDFDSINKEMPKLCYQNYRDKSVWSKQDILDYLSK